MSYAVKGVTTERGLDAGDFALVAYGGAGPLHAVQVAREIGIRKVIIPGAPGVFSAFGMLFSDLRYDYVRTHLMQLETRRSTRSRRCSGSWSSRAATPIAATSVKPHKITVKRALDMRYVGQEHPVTVDLPMSVFAKQDRKAIKQHFDDDASAALRHLGAGRARRDRQPAHHRHRADEEAAAGEDQEGQQRAAEAGVHRQAQGVVRRPASAMRRPTGAPSCWPATGSTGPALIEEHASTTVLMPGDTLTVDAYGNLVIAVAGAKLMAKARNASKRRKVDPVITEIVRNGVIAVTEEMKTNLMRTAYNMIIYEALDFTTGLFTPEGETVSIGIGLPMFIRGMAETVKAKIRHFGIKNMKPGDIYVTNDSYITGSHLNHFTFTLPIFHKGKLVGFSCCMAHWLDVGGVLGGMTTDIYSEGHADPDPEVSGPRQGQSGPASTSSA